MRTISIARHRALVRTAHPTVMVSSRAMTIWLILAGRRRYADDRGG